MDEADQNSDFICIIDKGKIIANGTPEQLKRSLGQDCIWVQTDNDHKAYQLIHSLAEVSKVSGSTNGLTVYLKENTNLITKLVDVLRLEGIQIIGISLVKPTLDDVFIHYTGRGFGDGNQEANGMGHGH
jgi:ABC-2 type transport system ATP-binding protein